MFRLLTVILWVLIAYKLATGFQYSADDSDDVNNQEVRRSRVDDWPMQNSHIDIDAVIRNISNYLSVSNFEKRSEHYSCASCFFTNNRTLLGHDVHPQFYDETLCDRSRPTESKSLCSGTCREVYHKINLLKLRPTDMDEDVLHDLPRALKSKYFWTQKMVSIDCRCAI